MSETVSEEEIIVRREGRAGRMTLSRPKALNALTYKMVLAIAEALHAWAADPAVELILLDGAGDRALCAGGDIRSLYDSRLQGPAFARKFWADEYHLNAFIKRFPKPYVAIQDGIVMGGGIGVSSHGSHRIVTERSHLAMPETAIGLIPDVGGTWILGHAPGEAGLYLGLTGDALKAADAIHIGFADTFVPSSALDALKADLCDLQGGAIDAVIARFKQDAGPGAVAGLAPQIAEGFSASTVEGILSALETMSGDWAAKTRTTLLGKSPKALKLSLAAIRQARGFVTLEEALDVEYRLVCRLFEDGEFPEGVRALIVDKDRKPKWNPERLEGVSEALVQSYLAPFPDGQELKLAKT
jgi:enoyl-CoA hydratase